MENRFDIYEVPAGHEARFERKLAGRLDQRIIFHRIAAWSAAVAAGVALFFVVAHHPFMTARTPEAVYGAYLEEVGKLYQDFSAKAGADSDEWTSLLQSMTDENRSLYDQLPDDLSEREKTLILKQYYSRLLEGVGELKSKMK